MFALSDSPSWLNNIIFFHNYNSQEVNQWLTPSLLLLSRHVCIFGRFESGTRCEELCRLVGTRVAAVRGWTGGGFYKNNSLTDNLLASSLQRPQVPFGEGAFLFQLHRESPESQGWSLWVLIAFFSPFLPECLFRQRQEGNESFTNINEALN